MIHVSKSKDAKTERVVVSCTDCCKRNRRGMVAEFNSSEQLQRWLKRHRRH